jgi:hypothetical protein
MEQADWEAAGKDPADWVSAREFNIRGELMGKIQGMGRKLNHLEQENVKLTQKQAALAAGTRQMVEKQYDKAMADIKRQRREAIEVGDYETLDELEERRDELKSKRDEMEALDEPVTPAAQPGQVDIASMHPIERAFMDIVNTTPALKNDAARAQAVGAYADQVWGNNPDISVVDFMRQVGDHMNPPRERGPAGPQEGTGNRGQAGTRAKSKYTKNDLDDMELDMGKTFVETGAFDDLQSYIDSMASTGELSIQQKR